ncbi:MAG: hypothetical protein KF789_02275 [Bdellovibrionaceae bacterium]|nr:hypothetical protein [Pseudobdellovibrionaceae bacterium]
MALFKRLTVLLAVFAICSGGALSAQALSIQDARSLKGQLGSEEASLSQLRTEIEDNAKQIENLSSQRRFLQRKSQAEKDLIRANKENAKKVTETQSRIELSKKDLRAMSKEILLQENQDYFYLQNLIGRLDPILTEGTNVVRQLKAAKSDLTTSQLSSGLNATTSALKSLDDSKPGLLDALAQVAAQAAADRALKDGQKSLQAAVAFDDRLSVFAHQDHGLLGGTWSAAGQRGLIFYLVTAGKNPLESNGFNLSTSLFQLSDLGAMKNEVQKALAVVEPIVNEMKGEAADLLLQTTRLEDEFMNAL